MTTADHANSAVASAAAAAAVTSRDIAGQFRTASSHSAAQRHLPVVQALTTDRNYFSLSSCYRAPRPRYISIFTWHD